MPTLSSRRCYRPVTAAPAGGTTTDPLALAWNKSTNTPVPKADY